MSAVINDYSPEDTGQTIGMKRPWGSVNSLEYWDGSGGHVIAADMTKTVNSVKGKTRYNHTQVTAATEWVINHGLNNTQPIVMAFDSVGRKVVCYENYETATVDSITLTFGTAVSGTAVVYSIPML